MKEPGTLWERRRIDISDCMENELLSHAYGWTPNEIADLSPLVKREYLAILQGRADAGG